MICNPNVQQPLIDPENLPDIIFSGDRDWLVCRVTGTRGCIPGVYVFPMDRLRMYGQHAESGLVWIALDNPIEQYDVDHSLEEICDLVLG